MPSYVLLWTWTEKGVGAVQDTVKRGEDLRAQGEKMGIRFREVLWTMGRFDGVAILEAPDDETASRFALWTGKRGTVKTETVRAYSETEISKIVQGL